MKRFDRQMHNRFNLYLASIFGVIVLFFLLQTYVGQFKPSTPTGAVVSTTYDIFELVGPPTSNTKIVTGSNPTPTAFKVANYYASDYALCGNGVIDEGEDCELSGVIGEDAWYDCRNCRFVGDGRVDYLDSATGLMEECDPGAPKFIPAIPPVNSCSGVQCSSTGNCPSGSYSTSLCAYGIYKDIMDGSSVFASYLNALGNLHCEDEALPFDCPARGLECGITPMDFMQLDVGSDVVLTRDDAISWLVQGGVSQNLAEIRADSRQLSINYPENYPEGSAETIEPSPIVYYNKYEMKLIMFSNGTSLLDYLNEVYTADLVPTIFGNFTVYVSNSSPTWVWYVGRVMFILSFYPDPYTAVPSLEEKQAGNAVLAAYLNQFGSDVLSAAAQAPLAAVPSISAPVQQAALAVCGNTIIEAGEQCDDGNIIDGDGCSSTCAFEIICGDNVCSAGENSINCQNDCPWGICGNHMCEINEVLAPETCPADCIGVCGNNIIEAQEWCDDGNAVNTDACVNCRNAACGDGFVQAGIEQCDDGNTAGGDGCSAMCVLEICGNGIVEAGEQCDDGNTAGGDGCSSTCAFEIICGDNACDAGENPNNCLNDCPFDVCGNNVCDGGENPITCPADCAT